MIIKIKIFQDKALVAAIIFSAIWHIFWLSMVNVVIIPQKTRPSTFSKVSFLGPILERGALKVRVEPRQRSLLEKRYLQAIVALPSVVQKADIRDSASRNETAEGFQRQNDTTSSGLIKEVLDTSKIEPIRDTE